LSGKLPLSFSPSHHRYSNTDSQAQKPYSDMEKLDRWSLGFTWLRSVHHRSMWWLALRVIQEGYIT